MERAEAEKTLQQKLDQVKTELKHSQDNSAALQAQLEKAQQQADKVTGTFMEMYCRFSQARLLTMAVVRPRFSWVCLSDE